MERIGPKKPVRWYLKEWRKFRGLTQMVVAERLETTHSVISELESGARRMNDDWMAGFAFAYGIEPADLLRDPNAPTVADLLRSAPREDQERIIDFIKRLTRAA
jgi:transcriptional regulator with XRE-family HTH domain